MLDTGQNALVFLIRTVIDLYLIILFLRLLFPYTRISAYNPLTQFIFKVTQPIVGLLQQFIPKSSRFNLAVMLPLVLLQMLKLGLLFMFSVGALPAPLGWFILAIADCLKLIINFYFYAILIMVIISWINPGLQSPAVEWLSGICEPLMTPARKLIPPIAGLDLSPIVVIVLLQLTSILLVQNIYTLGIQFA